MDTHHSVCEAACVLHRGWSWGVWGRASAEEGLLLGEDGGGGRGFEVGAKNTLHHTTFYASRLITMDIAFQLK